MPQLLTLEGIEDQIEAALCGHSVGDLIIGQAACEVDPDTGRPDSFEDLPDSISETDSLRETLGLPSVTGTLVGMGASPKPSFGRWFLLGSTILVGVVLTLHVASQRP